MKKVYIAAILILIFAGYLFPATFYIYTHEEYNGKTVPKGVCVREGLLEGLFEAGHIVFDNSQDSAKTDLLQEEHLATLIKIARNSEAEYILGVTVKSFSSTDAEKNNKVNCIATYHLIDVISHNSLDSGDIEINDVKIKSMDETKDLW